MSQADKSRNYCANPGALLPGDRDILRLLPLKASSSCTHVIVRRVAGLEVRIKFRLVPEQSAADRIVLENLQQSWQRQDYPFQGVFGRPAVSILLNREGLRLKQRKVTLQLPLEDRLGQLLAELRGTFPLPIRSNYPLALYNDNLLSVVDLDSKGDEYEVVSFTVNNASNKLVEFLTDEKASSDVTTYELKRWPLKVAKGQPAREIVRTLVRLPGMIQVVDQNPGDSAPEVLAEVKGPQLVVLLQGFKRVLESLGRRA